MARLFSGEATDAVDPLQHGIRLSPFDPQNFVWFQVLALALFFAGQREAALRAALRALKIRPSSRPALEKVVMCSVALGRIEEARTLVDQIHHLDKPEPDIFAQLKVRNPQWAEEMSSLLCDPALSQRPNPLGANG
jgi:tetratricopeptide (TPR) repeat protein